MIPFLRYRSDEWLMEALERQREARQEIGDGITPNDPRAPFWVITMAAISSYEHELGRRNVSPHEAPF